MWRVAQWIRPISFEAPATMVSVHTQSHKDLHKHGILRIGTRRIGSRYVQGFEMFGNVQNAQSWDIKDM